MGIFAASRPRMLATAAVAVLALAAMFGAGFVTARATGDEETDKAAKPATGLNANGQAVPPIARPGEGASGAVPAVSPGMTGTATGFADEARSSLMPGMGILPERCQATLPPVISGASIDLGKAGFATRFLGEGFTLRSFSLRSEGPCDENGQAATGTPVVDTSWLHAATGFGVSMSQRVASDPTPNVVSGQSAQVWVDGYAFTVWIDVYVPIAADTKEPARAGLTQVDGRGEEVLLSVLAELAPSVPDRCYYRQGQGTWADLATMGIGDPRPALPAGLSEQYVEFVTFAPPAADCNAPALPVKGSFTAAFGSDPGAKGGTFVQVSAYPTGNGIEFGYGYLGDGNASWTNGPYAFSVSGYDREVGLSRSSIETIARAMDPGFSAACFVQTRELGASELPGLGLSVPVPPDGFTLVKSNLAITEGPAAGCAAREGFETYPQVMLNWVFQGKGGIIEASAYQQGGGAGLDREGSIQDGYLNWTDGRGVRYSVSGYGSEDGKAIDRETLLKVARSMDSGLDPEALTDGPAQPEKVMPPQPLRD